MASQKLITKVNGVHYVARNHIPVWMIQTNTPLGEAMARRCTPEEIEAAQYHYNNNKRMIDQHISANRQAQDIKSSLLAEDLSDELYI